MKNIFFTLCLWLTGSVLWAQQQESNPELFIGNAVQQDVEIQGATLHIQIGNPIHYSIYEYADGTSLSIRFPWDVAYIPLTFGEEHFEVSKGYFSEKVLLDWAIQSNASKIDQIKIFRRTFDEANLNDVDNYVLIATLSSDSYSYEDTNTEGGLLYEYKVEAVGVSSIPKKYVTYITGVGYRNPTGVVTGNISFDGGSPVKDVVVRADPQGADQVFGSSLSFTDISLLSIPLRNKELNELITLQAWVKLNEGSAGVVFKLEDNQRTTDEVWVSYTTTAGSLDLTVSYNPGLSKTFTISEYYPTGNIDGRGDDLFNAFSDIDLPESNFAENFAHISIVLENGMEPLFYLNGRNISEDYLSTLPEETTSVPTITTSGNYIFNGFETAEVKVADGLFGNIDEVRLWNEVLDETQIRTDFKRYLGGAEPNLISYVRCDEKAGNYAYDISKSGFEFNKNHARIYNGTWTDDKPTSSQLGILGVTDALGNYIISAIPFSGTGESYTITPMYGVHQFEPSQQLVFVGNGAEVINKIDFKDISSFNFLGVIYYTTTGVFEPIAPVDNVTSVLEGGYNQYSAIIDGNEQLISKGKHYYDESDPDNPVLFETPKVYVPGAYIYIDGNIVLDGDNRPVVTDEQGFFQIKVPIGNHYIEVGKDKHGFTHEGRFPAAREDGDDLFEFFEHQESAVTFLDTTRVSLTGRVVGGSIEAAKPIGFGFNGPIIETYNPGTEDELIANISSINNIGVATITLSYLPFGGTPGIGELEHTFTTHPETGEYKVDLLPLSYTINQSNGLRINNNVDIQLLDANETVNLSEPKDPTFSEYENASGDPAQSDPYHYEKSFTYRSTPVLNVMEQSSDVEVLVTVNDENGNPQQVPISTEGMEYPVYTQFLPYVIVFQTFEEYINYDDGPGNEVFDQVPIADGDFNITNNLALLGTEEIVVDPEDQSVSTYFFEAGLPSISPPFTRTIDIKYRVDGKDFDARNYNTEGIILGGQSDGSQTFVTQAPDVPDIILRDPPGSNSFASIESGSTISFTEEGSFNYGQEAGIELELKLGVKFAAGGGLAGPVIESETVNSLAAGISFGVESSHGESVTKTYTFNQTISTSDDPGYVGSDGDLYIGNTNNYFYGSYDNVKASSVPIGDGPFGILTNDNGELINISKQKAFYFNEEPSATFFIYSQKHIVETLIPELEGIIEGIDLGTISEDTPGVLTRAQYQEQIRQWQTVIQDNERTKYLSLTDRENYKSQIRTNIEKEIGGVNEHLIAITVFGAVATPFSYLIGAQTLAEAITMLTAKKQNLEQKLEFLEAEFLRNVSFDAGVGEYTKTSEITLAEEKTRNISFNFDASLEVHFGFELNEAGLLVHTRASANTSLTSALTEEESNTTTVSYTLSDPDDSNYLSVDVVNTFDGNGPIFSTVGGRTSCPHEGIDTTLFYNHTEATESQQVSGTIYSGGEQIGYATQQVEVPKISVLVASVTDVPEERAAEFTLILENNSVSESDGYFELYIDNTSNPYNAIMNIPANGTVVFVPYGEQVEYALTMEKSISDVYEYKDIDIYLGSECDPSTIYDYTTVSAIFKPSCTAVEIDNPLENWVINAGDAYNIDNTTNPLSITMFGYDRSFNSFENYRLEYRKATSSSWTRLRSYYNTQELLDDAIIEGEDKGTLITANSTTFPWDIGALGLSDGQYEMRAISNCSNGTDFISEVIKGTIDLNIPVQFGTPSPIDGILGAGEDLRLQFSEDILYSSAISKIEIKGETNQQDINHNVSIHFEGEANTMVLEKPNIVVGDFSMEFWLQNHTIGSGVLFDQPDALRVVVNSGVMEWTLGDQTLTKPMAVDQDYHHYTLTYSADKLLMRIYQDDQELGSLNASGLMQRSESPLVVGGNSFIGNLHDLRFWSKPLTLSEAYAAQFKELMGSERDLIGYWPMNEGAGEFAHDLARFKHAAINAAWDIKPKGTAYEFDGAQYLILDKVGFVQLTDLMDITLSFWVKTDNPQKATIFSNGRGNGEDLIQSNGSANKWSVSMENGILYLHSEGLQYTLSSTNLADNNWHHVAIVLRRIGSLKTYIDASLESSNLVSAIGGLSSFKIWIGARGFVNSANEETIDEVFAGKIDELRLWNMARAYEQINRDRFNEVDFNTTGLMLYAKMNEPDPVTGSGPKYYHLDANQIVLPDNATMSSGAASYTGDAPKIKLDRPYLTFEVVHVINGDEMIITPLVSDWSVLEGQIIDITVDRMFDVYGNRQSSPITWSAFVRRNEVRWFADDGTQQLNIEKLADEQLTFELTILNSGGKQQPFTIENVPNWLNASELSGTLAPNSSTRISFEVNKDLGIGEYSLDLYLDTDFNFDEKMLVNLRVLDNSPSWNVDPGAFEFSMNVIGILNIDGNISSDELDKVAAFVGGEVRGLAELEYNEAYDLYFVFLSIYSNQPSGEEVDLKVWDASTGIIYPDVTPDLTFLSNDIIGTFSGPVTIQTNFVIEQEISLSQGWNWVSFSVNATEPLGVSDLFTGIVLGDGDYIKYMDAFAQYSLDFGWSGNLVELNSTYAYKIRLGSPAILRRQGQPHDINTLSFDLAAGWNWLCYPILEKTNVNVALGLYDAVTNDVIKDQVSFAIYDDRLGWVGSLTHLKPGKGYMFKSQNGGSFNYQYLNNSASRQKDDEQEVLHHSNAENTESTIIAIENEEYLEGDKLLAMRGNDEAGQVLWTHLANGERRYFMSIDEGPGDIRYFLNRDETLHLLAVIRYPETISEYISGGIYDPLVLKLLESPSGNRILYVHANPNYGSFRYTIKRDRASYVALQLVNMHGKIIWTDQRSIDPLYQSELKVNSTPGIYLLRAMFDDGISETITIIIK